MSISTSQFIPPYPLGASLVAQLVKNLLAIQETLVPFLGREDLLQKGLATHSTVFLGFPGGSDGKESDCNAGYLGLTCLISLHSKVLSRVFSRTSAIQ